MATEVTSGFGSGYWGSMPWGTSLPLPGSPGGPGLPPGSPGTPEAPPGHGEPGEPPPGSPPPGSPPGTPPVFPPGVPPPEVDNPEAPNALYALAVRENLVRLRFDAPVYYSLLKDDIDASNSELFTYARVLGTQGLDGQATRAVSVVNVEQTPGWYGLMLDLWLDRPMTSYGQLSQYNLSVTGLVNANSLAPITPVTLEVDALFKEIIRPSSLAAAVTGKDFANPSLASMLKGLPIEAGDNPDRFLGKFQIDATRDVAFDDTRTSYKKRVIRRLTTKRDSFAHLPGYGVGFLGQVKRLAVPAIRERLALEAEEQIRQEPETVSVSVQIIPRAHNVWVYRIRVVASFDRKGFEFEAPVAV